MKIPEERTAEEIVESEIIQRIVDEEFEAVDRHFSTPLKHIQCVDVPIMIEDEITHMLVLNFRPFLHVLLAQIVRKAHSRMLRSPGTKSTFTIEAIKGVTFLAYQETFSDVQYLVITTGKRLPTRTKKGDKNGDMFSFGKNGKKIC